MKYAAIIQARMGAKARLPNKVMLDICGKPMLWHVIGRAKQAIPDVIVATPDKEIADYADAQGVYSFIGDEENVLHRYMQCAQNYQVENIVRLTADNPLVEPEMIKKLIKFYEDGGYDWAANCRLKITYPIGNDVEVFSFDALETAWYYTDDPYCCQHVTPYIYHHSELFKLGVMENDKDESHLRWTVDTMEDLENVKRICSLAETSAR